MGAAGPFAVDLAVTVAAVVRPFGVRRGIDPGVIVVVLRGQRDEGEFQGQAVGPRGCDGVAFLPGCHEPSLSGRGWQSEAALLVGEDSGTFALEVDARPGERFLCVRDATADSRWLGGRQ